MKCPLFNFCDSITAVCRVSEPDEGCYYYRYFSDLIQRKEKKKKKKKKSVRDGCTVSGCPDWSDSREERCVWRSTNPGNH